MKNDDRLDNVITESLGRIRSWEPPPTLGLRLAESLPATESVPRFRLRMPRLTGGAIGGLGAALVGALAEQMRTVAPSWMIAIVMLGIGSWVLANALAISETHS